MSYLVGLQCGVTQLVFIVSPLVSAATHSNGWILGIMENLQMRKQKKKHKKKKYSVIDMIHHGKDNFITSFLNYLYCSVIHIYYIACTLPPLPALFAQMYWRMNE